MAQPASTFPALTTALLAGDTRLASWTWQQQFLEWQQKTASLPQHIPLVQFGVGTPTVTGAEGCLYFDTTGSPYHGYVYNAGAWHIFS